MFHGSWCNYIVYINIVELYILNEIHSTCLGISLYVMYRKGLVRNGFGSKEKIELSKDEITMIAEGQETRNYIICWSKAWVGY